MSVTLISKYANLRFIVSNTETVMDPQRGPVVVKPGKVVKFQNNLAEVDDDVWNFVKQSSAYVGDRGEKVIWRADDEDAPVFGGGSGVTIRSGVLTGSAGVQKNEPLVGWDNMTVKEIQQAITSGRVSDYSEAIEWESRKGGRRRSTVIKALANMLDARVAPSESEAVSADDTFSAPAPAGDSKDD